MCVRTTSITTTHIKLAVGMNEETSVTETTRREVPVITVNSKAHYARNVICPAENVVHNRFTAKMT